MNAVASGWLRRGVVIDNERVHSGGSADVLPDVLWNAEGLDGLPLHLTVVPYPTRAPELNPIEMSWQIYVKRVYSFNAGAFASNV